MLSTFYRQAPKKISGEESFEYGNEYELDVSDIYNDSPIGTTLAPESSTEKPFDSQSKPIDNQFVPTVKPGRKLLPEKELNENSNLLLNGLNIPIYLIVLICVGFGLLLWISAWIGWSCRKCCQAQKDRDEKYIRNEIFGEKHHRHQTDPLPIPDSGYKVQPGAALVKVAEVASSQVRFYTSHNIQPSTYP